MKRIVCCILTLLVLFAICCGMAHADTCNHVWIETTGEPIIMYEAISDLSHAVVTYVGAICKNCNTYSLQPSSFVSPRIESHDFVYVRDAGHGAGNEHFYVYQCEVCEHYVVFTEECNGPPCISIGYKIDIPAEDVSE